MNIAVKLPPLMTVADFIDWPGDGIGTRYELVDGELRAMAPGSSTHGTLQSRLASLITQHLDKARPGCRVVTTPGIQPHLQSSWNFRIPDLAVTCAPDRPGDIMLPDPILIVEVLSPGNAQDTRGNIPHYASLPSVGEIVIVHSTAVKVELLARQPDGSWPKDPEFIVDEGDVTFASVGLTIGMADIYRNTHLRK